MTNQENNFPQTLQQAIVYFNNPDNALNFMVSLRWPDGVITCPQCGSDQTTFISTRRTWQCKNKDCKKMFTVKLGTVMEDSPIGLDKWLSAMWMIGAAKNGISSYEIHRALGITQKSAWFLMHRIRMAMKAGTFDKLSGEVEVDETFIGGKARNMHKSKRKGKIAGTGGYGKVAVMGLLERGGEVTTKVIPNTQRKTLHGEVRDNIAAGATVYTDEWVSYKGLSDDYIHQVINHAQEYVNGRIHTNGIENFWSLLKRCLKGTYVSVEPFHLFRYLDEQSFRFNHRKVTDQIRFLAISQMIVGRRLTYQQLTGKSMNRSMA